MKFLIVNQHTLNMGDDAAGVALATQIRELFKDAEIHFVYNHKKEVEGVPFRDERVFHHNIIITKKDTAGVIVYIVSKLFPFVRQKSSIKRYLDLLQDTDYVIVSPCGANIGIYRDKAFLIRILIAVLEGKRPVFHLSTIGKSGSFLFDKVAKFVLKRSEVFVREGKSYEELQRWGISCQRGVDTAFSLISGKIEKEHTSKKAKDYLAFIPTNLQQYFPKFPNKNVNSHLYDCVIPDLTEFCRKKKYAVRILPHTIDYEGKYEGIVEQMKSAFIKAGMNRENVTVVDDMKDFIDYENAIKNARMVVSMRYHGVIFAIKNSIPYLALSYENKMREACIYSQMTDYYIDLKKTDSYNYLEIMNKLENHYEEVRSILAEKKAFFDRMARLPIQKLYIEYLSAIS